LWVRDLSFQLNSKNIKSWKIMQHNLIILELSVYFVVHKTCNQNLCKSYYN
jgi:hypothetical protein